MSKIEQNYDEILSPEDKFKKFFTEDITPMLKNNDIAIKEDPDSYSMHYFYSRHFSTSIGYNSGSTTESIELNIPKNFYELIHNYDSLMGIRKTIKEAGASESNNIHILVIDNIIKYIDYYNNNRKIQRDLHEHTRPPKGHSHSHTMISEDFNKYILKTANGFPETQVGHVLKNLADMNDTDILYFLKAKEYYIDEQNYYKERIEKTLKDDKKIPEERNSIVHRNNFTLSEVILPAIKFLDISEKGLQDFFPEIYKRFKEIEKIEFNKGFHNSRGYTREKND